jgi:hypothetical protein
MATIYKTPQYNDVAVSYPIAGVVVVPVKYTVGGTAISQVTGDTLRIAKVPKGAQIRPQECEIVADADPDSGNNLTVSLKVTDGTTTKTVISTSNLQAANARLTASATDIADLGFFATSNDDFYFVLTPEAGDLDAAAVINVTVAYTMDPSRDASLT